MAKITTYSFCEPFIDRFVDDLDRDYVQKGKDLSRVAIVFGGHRPALFVKRQLSRRIGKAFYPPRFFSIDEFMGYVVSKHDRFSAAQDLDQCYLMYRLVKRHCPRLLARREAFAQFLSWAREILAFIEQLDLECVDNDRLKGVERNAQIGYDVPADINDILSQVTVLREAYHAHMQESLVYTRGFQYRRAAETVAQTNFEEFDEILFANFFYFNRAQEAVVRALYEADKARLFFQGDQRRWPVLQRIARALGTEIKEGKAVDEPKFALKLYRGFDMHSQVCQLREILKTISDLDRTVVVLPDADHIIPLLSEIGPGIRDLNVSMGYPLKRSSLVSLMEQVFQAQGSRDERGYYVQDYLKVMRHPLVKTLFLHADNQVVRVLIHKIEEVLTGREEGSISGCVFLSPEDVAGCESVFLLARDTLRSMGADVSLGDLRQILGEIHALCFTGWEGIGTFERFGAVLCAFLDLLVDKSLLKNYPLNIRIASRIYDIVDELRAAGFAREDFPPEDLFRIFSAKVEREIVAFAGSPLKGLQILGLFETRSLNFDHVIVLDANEGVLPHLSVYEALVPRDVMISLNLDRLELEEEIQRYGFMRLISSAKDVHLIYQENRERERSRFVEELVWEREKVAKRRGVVPVASTYFPVRAQVKKRQAQKTRQIIEFLRDYRYSASSVNLYLRDPMEFYCQHVLGLREQDDLLDEPENRQVGIFLHEYLEEVFRGFVGRKPVIDKKFLKYAGAVLDRRFDEMFGRTRRADVFFLKRVIDERMKRFWEREARRCQEEVQEVVCVEKRFEDVLPLDAGRIKFVYKIDRVDRLNDGTVMLLDYKTGSADVMPGKIGDVEALTGGRKEIFEVVKSFQLPLYFHYIKKRFAGQGVNAGVYNLRDCQIRTFLGKRTGDDPERIDRVFLQALNRVMAEILDPEIPFLSDES